MAEANRYAAGNCTWWCKNQADWIPNGWGNAAEWLTNARNQGYQTSQTPQVGAIAIWGPGVDPPWGYGHCAKVTAVRSDGTFTVTEMNWQGLGKVDNRNVSDRSNLSGFILPPGAAATGSGDFAGIGSAIQQSGGQLISSAQVGSGALLVLGGLLIAVLLVARPR